MSADHPHLLSALRDELDITSPKDGCSPSGQCGCCTVLVDGKAVVSCNLPLDKVAGKSVVTLEGVDAGERDRFAEAFAACGGLQCGFCIPGIVMRAKSQIDKKGADLDRTSMAPPPRRPPLPLHRLRQDPRRDRGGGAGTSRSNPAWRPGVGESGAKYEAGELALGDRGYVDDIRVPGTLHAALVFADHARADVVAIDTAAATAAPGVVGVFTAADIPGELRVGIIHKDWPVMIPVGGRTSYAGDVLAIVVAETRRAGPFGGGPRRGRLPTRCRRSPTRSPPSSPAPSWPCGAPTTTCCRAAPTPAATSTAPSPPAPTPCTRCSRPNASSTPSSNPSRRSPCPPTTPTPASGRSTCTPAGRACGTTATTSAACSPCRPIGWWWSWCRTAVPSAARRT